MSNRKFMIILLPTLKCDACCDYCFEHKDGETLTTEKYGILITKLFDYMDSQGLEQVTIFWQGGEVLTLQPEWFLRAHDLAEKLCRQRGKKIANLLQSNLIGYHKNWNHVLAEFFDNDVGSSLDFPNLYRKTPRIGPEAFNELWIERFREARSHGIEVGTISVLNSESLRVGAKDFYSYYVNHIGIKGLQINFPFPGGSSTPAKRQFPLPNGPVTKFCIELVDLWMERGYSEGVKIGPFDVLLDAHLNGNKNGLPCIWSPNCVNEIMCIGPSGHVSQCDSWVTAYPDFRFGNIFSSKDFSEVLQSPVRQRFQNRPVELIKNESCLECDCLSFCHGGCPIRAYSTNGTLFSVDPYCETYRALFKHMEGVARKILAGEYCKKAS
jgi:uncharacterized protein